jgi:hypothetical protein
VDGGEIEQEKYFLEGKFQYPGLCFACLPAGSPAFARGGKGVAAGDFLNTLERSLLVRDSGRHWGITSSFFAGLYGTTPRASTNLIVKPATGATGMMRKRQREVVPRGAATLIVARDASPSDLRSETDIGDASRNCARDTRPRPARVERTRASIDRSSYD